MLIIFRFNYDDWRDAFNEYYYHVRLCDFMQSIFDSASYQDYKKQCGLIIVKAVPTVVQQLKSNSIMQK